VQGPCDCSGLRFAHRRSSDSRGSHAESAMILGPDAGCSSMQRTYVVEPVLRDDGRALWDFGENARNRARSSIPRAIGVERRKRKMSGRHSERTKTPDLGTAAGPVAPEYMKRHRDRQISGWVIAEQYRAVRNGRTWSEVVARAAAIRVRSEKALRPRRRARIDRGVVSGPVTGGGKSG